MKVERLSEFKVKNEFNPLTEALPIGYDGLRYYEINGKSYPSITSVLGYFKREAIQEWRNRVGAEEANKISAKASRRGTRIHNMIEKYLKNEPMATITEGANTLELVMFKDMLPTLSRIDNIFLQERALYSEQLKVAGRCDLGADFDGVPSIIDFKTSLREKKEEHVQDYFEQATAYALMYESMTGNPISQIVLIIANDENPLPQVFVHDPQFYIPGLTQKLEEFHRLHSG